MSVIQKISALLLALAALAGLALTCLFVVDQRQYTMVYGAGQLQRLVQEPGLQFKQPWPLQEVRTLDKRTLLAVGDTGKQPLASSQGGQSQRLPISWYVQWRITDVQHYLQHVGQTADAGSARLNDTLLPILQGELAHAALGHLLADANAMTVLQQKLTRQLNVAAQGSQPWGVQVLDVRLTRMDVDQAAAKAIEARMAVALQQSVAQIRQEAASAAAAVEAEAESQRAAVLAEGQRQALRIRGEGDAQAIRIYAPDHAQSPQLASFLRALEVYRKSFGAGDVLLIDPASNALIQNLQNQRNGKPQPPDVPPAPAQGVASAAAATSAAASAPAAVLIPQTTPSAASATTKHP